MPVPLIPIAIGVGRLAFPTLAKEFAKRGGTAFIKKYGRSTFNALVGGTAGYEVSKFIPGIHGPKTKEQEEIEKIGQKETFPIQEWDKSYIDTGTKIPEPEKIEPPVNIPVELPKSEGFPIPEQKTWKDYIFTQAKTKDITKQTKDLVTKEPEFGALTETESKQHYLRWEISLIFIHGLLKILRLLKMINTPKVSGQVFLKVAPLKMN